jgi:hypothetical protein
MPFKSKAQQKWMFANHPEMAKRWADHTPDIKELPETVKTAAELGRHVAQMQKEAINFGGLMRSFAGNAVKAPTLLNAAERTFASAAPAATGAVSAAAAASAQRVAARNAAATAARNAARAARAAKAAPHLGETAENVMALGRGIKQVAAPVGTYFKNLAGYGAEGNLAHVTQGMFGAPGQAYVAPIGKNIAATLPTTMGSRLRQGAYNTVKGSLAGGAGGYGVGGALDYGYTLAGQEDPKWRNYLSQAGSIAGGVGGAASMAARSLPQVFGRMPADPWKAGMNALSRNYIAPFERTAGPTAQTALNATRMAKNVLFTPKLKPLYNQVLGKEWGGIAGDIEKGITMGTGLVGGAYAFGQGQGLFPKDKPSILKNYTEHAGDAYEAAANAYNRAMAPPPRPVAPQPRAASNWGGTINRT